MLLKIFGLFFGVDSTVADLNFDEPQLPPDDGVSASLSGAHDFVINQPTMIDRMQMVNNIYVGKTVFEVLLPFCSIGAMADSSARDPPPRCHPKTRQSVRERLSIWSCGGKNKWNMVWLHGPAGVGKSAVAQTFAEDCQARNRLGGAFFFSRLKGFNKPLQVIPTFAYQLAVNIPVYKIILAQLLADDPVVLQKAMHIQFRKLIIEPLSTITSNYPSGIQQSYIMILDGLDECEGENTQCEIIEMISEVTRLRSDLPLLWLICSRSESHLKMTLSRADFTINCGQEELLIDDETRTDVDQYLRDGLQKIRSRYRYVITSELWPDEHSMSEVQHIASGLFILAFSALEYIQDSEYANPEDRLRSLLSFFQSTNHLARNPLVALDLLYTHILSAVPDHALPIALRVITCGCVYSHRTSRYKPLMKHICDYLRLDETTAYSSLRKLHSVVRVPPPEESQLGHLDFHHLSFFDFLQNPIRSGKFNLLQALPEVVECSLFWRSAELHAKSSRAIEGDYPRLQEGNRLGAYFPPWETCCRLGTRIKAALSHQLYEFPYSLLSEISSVIPFANWLHDLDPPVPNNFLRTQPYYEEDFLLLKCLRCLIDPLEPASFPIDPSHRAKYPPSFENIYFLLGHDSKSCLNRTQQSLWEDM